MPETPKCPVAVTIENLIAAGPELLEACRFARNYFQIHAGMDQDVRRHVDRAEHLEHHASVMDRAIAKAEGREVTDD
jgi:hypothetical protein